ncbi:MAG: 1,4-alpha-glucan branching protein GlgB [Rubellimicrobium sp.]|nr:1,4-alpha-glucan branching protein GlgB [Rubellimicrobium sp.]
MAPDTVARLLAARDPDPFAHLGPHRHGRALWIAAIDPGADTLAAVIAGREHDLPRLEGALFMGKVPGNRDGSAKPYALRGRAGGAVWDYEDAYRFGPVLGELDEYLLGEGTHLRLWHALGAHVMVHEGTAGVHFAVWAPNARRVSVVGDFNAWDGRRHMMRHRGSTGVWEIFIPGAGEGARYKYEIIGPDDRLVPLKADPVGFGAEHPPATASVVRDISGYGWHDRDWMAARAARNRRDAPLSIYEVHLPSWRRRDDGRSLSYRELAEELVDYAQWMGFTHLEFLPVSEYPFDGSWGYQPVGMYAPTIRMGPPHEFRDLVDAAHRAGLGVILDWVPGHFPADAHGLAHFDGTALYEHADPREGFHQDWNTLIYNYGRREVANFLIANALYWLEDYHIDGLRVDAVASMLYRDYSRKAGEWVPNRHGGRENLEAIAFMQRMNIAAYGADSSIMTIAEESTSFPGVSTPVDAGGLGFGFKWNMGWMNDTLRYIAHDPVHRRWHHDDMTRPLTWAFSENFILPISHDEVVHGKKSMLGKMPGNEWERFANLRAYYGFMWGQPGKKLLFMGQEVAQGSEWHHDAQVDWAGAQGPLNKGVQALVRDLNRLYRGTPALHVRDCDGAGFRWISYDDAESSCLAWARLGGDGDAPVIVAVNFTPVERNWRIGAPQPGFWEEVLNTDAAIYGGGNRGNMGGRQTDAQPCHGEAQSFEAVLPPLAAVFFRLKTQCRRGV